MKSLILVSALILSGLTSQAATKAPAKVPACKDKVSVTSNGPFTYRDEQGTHPANFSGDYVCGLQENATGVLSVFAPATQLPVPDGYFKIESTLIIEFLPGAKATLLDHLDIYMCQGSAHDCQLSDQIELAELKCDAKYTICTSTNKDMNPPLIFNVTWPKVVSAPAPKKAKAHKK